jgi:hypothetical protein
MVDIGPVLSYLRETGVLKGDPVFSLQRTELVPKIIPQAYWDEYLYVRPYWGEEKVDYHKNMFESLHDSLQGTTRVQARESTLARIPDSEQSVVIEMGSHYGINLGGTIAAFRPKAKVILIDKGWEDRPEACFDFMFEEFPAESREYFGNVLRFTKESPQDRSFENEPNLERRVNKLYHSNDIHNIEFRQVELTPGNINSVLGDVRGKNVYIVGQRVPGKLIFTTIKAYRELNAKHMNISLVAIEKISRDHPTWGVVQRNLGLSSGELEGFFKSCHDPEALRRPDVPSKKYDYEKPGQTRIGKMIKLAFAAALAREVNGRVLINSDTAFVRNYNQEDHYIEA